LKKENPKISIILSNYNGEKYITLAIESFFNQEYSEKEIIIVDGKSSDRSHEIINKFSERYSNLKWVQKMDDGISDAINIGLKYCSGDIIMQMGHDDILHDNVFSVIASYSKIIDFDIIYFDSYNYFIQEKRSVLRKCPNIEINRKNLLEYGSIVGGQSTYFKRHVFEKFKFNVKNKYCMDYEFLLTISDENYLYFYVPSVGIISICDSNISTTLGPISLEGIKVAFKFAINYRDVLNIYSRYYSINNGFQLIFYFCVSFFRFSSLLFRKKNNIEFITFCWLFKRL
tara:strand:+ start:2584 stop:3441 length:858 start_codon:yes stop_codon:yes gene_type:complete